MTNKAMLILEQYLKYYFKRDVQMVFAMMFFVLGAYLIFSEKDTLGAGSLVLAVLLILTRGLTKSYDDCKTVMRTENGSK